MLHLSLDIFHYLSYLKIGSYLSAVLQYILCMISDIQGVFVLS